MPKCKQKKTLRSKIADGAAKPPLSKYAEKSQIIVEGPLQAALYRAGVRQLNNAKS